MTISDNGGYFLNDGGSVILNNVTLTGNYKSEDIMNNSGTLTFTNSILGRCGCSVHSTCVSQGHNISNDNYCSLMAPGDKVNTDPLLVPLALINGQWVNDGPCRSWPDHFQYDVLDVGSCLNPGQNEILVLARYYGVGDFHRIPQQA